MIACISTSSPTVSVALLDNTGAVISSGRADAPRAASGTALTLLGRLLEEQGMKSSELSGLVADIGPGSFTGVKVGVTIVKLLGALSGCHVAGVTSFDLVDPGRAVAIAGRKGEWLLRELHQEPKIVGAVQLGTVKNFAPDASKVTALFDSLSWMTPERLVPLYVALPSISMPKKPYGADIADA